MGAKAISIVAGWIFKPETKDDVPVPVKVAVEVNLRLH